MEFDIYFRGSLDVYHQGQLFLYAKIKKLLRMTLTFYQLDRHILTTSLFYWWFPRKVKIKYQDLPYPIDFYMHVGAMVFELAYNGHLIQCAEKFTFTNPYYHLFLDGNEIGVVECPKNVIFGYRQFKMLTTTEDETENIYLLLSFLLQLVPD